MTMPILHDSLRAVCDVCKKEVSGPDALEVLSGKWYVVGRFNQGTDCRIVCSRDCADFVVLDLSLSC